jgi:hypothetical protein
MNSPYCFYNTNQGRRFAVGDLVKVVRIQDSTHFDRLYNVGSFEDIEILSMRDCVFTVLRDEDEDGDYLLSNNYFIHGDDLEFVGRGK